MLFQVIQTFGVFAALTVTVQAADPSFTDSRDESSSLAAQCKTTISGLLGSATKSIMDDDPNLCSHNRMLQDGESVYIVYYLYNNERLKLAMDASAGIDSSAAGIKAGTVEANYQNYISWGICSKKIDGASSAGGAGSCLDRIKRQDFLATAHARQEILKMGTTRADLLMQGGKNDSIAVPQHDTVLKDLGGLASGASGQVMNIEKPATVQDILRGPRPVSFDSVDVGTVTAASGVDASKLVGDQAAQLDDTSKHFEAQGQGKAAGLDGQVQSALGNISATVKGADQKANDDEAKSLAGAAASASGAQALVAGGNINILAFKNAMLTIKDAELSKNAKNKLLAGSGSQNSNDFSSIAKLDAQTDISGTTPPAAGTTGSTTVDRELATEACALGAKGCGGNAAATATNGGSAKSP